MTAVSAEGPTGTIRRLSPDDLDRVIDIDRALSGVPRRGFFETRLASAIRHPDAFVQLGWIENGALEGFVFAHVLDGEFGGTHPVAILDALGTSTATRGHGGAHALMTALEAAARKRGVRELRSQTLWSDQALTRFFAAAGFALAPNLVLDRACARRDDEIPPGAFDESGGEDLSQARVPVRTLRAGDLSTIVSIDRRITGRDRAGYFGRKARENLEESGIRLSMVAEADDTTAGFVMARVDYGEFGRADSEAVLDTIGVDPEFRDRDVGSALLVELLGQLETLRVDRVRTEVPWNAHALLAFLEARGFRPSQRLTFARAL